jgi:hypothetical protein
MIGLAIRDFSIHGQGPSIEGPSMMGLAIRDFSIHGQGPSSEGMFNDVRLSGWGIYDFRLARFLLGSGRNNAPTVKHDSQAITRTGPVRHVLYTTIHIGR